MNRPDADIAITLKEIRKSIEDYSTIDGVTISFNLLVGKLRVCCIQGDKQDILNLVKQIHEEMVQEVEKMY